MNFIIQYGVDLGLIMLLAVLVVSSVRKGFVRTVLTLFAVVLAFGLAGKTAEPVASWSYDTFLNKTVCEKIDENASRFKADQTTKQIVDEVARLMPEYLREKLSDMNIDLEKTKNQLNSVADTSGFSPQQISDSLVKPAAMIMLKMVSTLLCFLVFMTLLRIVIHWVCKVVKLPVLRSADKLLGGALGFLKGIVIIYVLSMLCGLIGQVTAQTDVKQAIEQSKIVTACQQTDLSDKIAGLFDKNSTE